MNGKGTLLWTLTFAMVLTSAPVFAAEPDGAGVHQQIVASALRRFLYKQKVLGENAAFSVAKQEFPLLPIGKESLQEPALRKKSKGRAFFQSLIFPGWGQHYAGSRTMMKTFIISEVVLWGSYIGFTVWSNWLEDDFRSFAAEHAGVQLEGKPGRYFVAIGNFDSLQDYNQAQLRDRDVNALYPQTPEFFWNWDSDENRLAYRDLRVRSDRAQNRADLTLAIVFVNHLLSAIHSTLAVFRFNERLKKQGFGLNVKPEWDGRSRRLKVSLTKSF